MSRWWARDPCESLVVNLPSQRRSGRRGQLRRYNVMVVSDVWPSKTTRFARKAAKRAETAAESDETKECFWRQRARRFHVDAHFPALVSQQLLPGWHAISPEDEDEYDTRQQPPAGYFGFSQTLFKTTASCNAKFQKKDVAEEEKIRLPWMAIGNAGSADLCGRGPVLHLGDTYRDEPVKARSLCCPWAVLPRCSGVVIPTSPGRAALWPTVRVATMRSRSASCEAKRRERSWSEDTHRVAKTFDADGTWQALP